MALSDIKIEKQLPVINGFVVIPDQEVVGRYKLEATDVTGTQNSSAIISGSSTFRTGQKPTDDLRIKLPEFSVGDGYTEDYHQILRDE